MPETWPAALRTQTSTWQLVGQTRSGGTSPFNAEQVAASRAGRWRASLQLPIASPDAVLAYRALVSRLRGRARSVLVPVCGTYGPAIGSGPVTAKHSDAAPFSDGSPYYSSGTSSASLSTPAAAGGTDLFLSTSSALEPGQHLSFSDGRLHVIGTAAAVAGGWHLTVQPPLRAAYPSGTAIELDHPTALMRLDADDAGALALELLRFGTPQLNLVEAS